MSQVPAKLELPEIQQSFREVWKAVNAPLDLKGRSISNAGEAKGRGDLVTLGQVEKLITKTQDIIVTSINGGSFSGSIDLTGTGVTISPGLDWTFSGSLLLKASRAPRQIGESASPWNEVFCHELKADTLVAVYPLGFGSAPYYFKMPTTDSMQLKDETDAVIVEWKNNKMRVVKDLEPYTTGTPSLGSSTSVRWLKLWVGSIDASGAITSASTLTGNNLYVNGSEIVNSSKNIINVGFVDASSYVNTVTYKRGGSNIIDSSGNLQNITTITCDTYIDASTVFRVSGTQVVSAQGAAVSDASGGATVDAEARQAINNLLARVRTHGLIAT